MHRVGQVLSAKKNKPAGSSLSPSWPKTRREIEKKRAHFVIARNKIFLPEFFCFV